MKTIWQSSKVLKYFLFFFCLIFHNFLEIETENFRMDLKIRIKNDQDWNKKSKYSSSPFISGADL
jgi:hypothetical protein